jgi:hypothetical protein
VTTPRKPTEFGPMTATRCPDCGATRLAPGPCPCGHMGPRSVVAPPPDLAAAIKLLIDAGYEVRKL